MALTKVDALAQASMLTSDNLELPSEAEAEEWRALELLAVLEQLELRGLLTTELNDLGELRLTPTAAGIAAVREEEASRAEG